MRGIVALEWNGLKEIWNTFASVILLTVKKLLWFMNDANPLLIIWLEKKNLRLVIYLNYENENSENIFIFCLKKLE